MTSVACTVDSPIGTLTLVARADALVALELPGRVEVPSVPGDARVLAEARAQVRAYFAGELTSFDLPLDPAGTNFQKRVWQELVAIPFGETWSYGQLAARIGKPHASRAVGLANGKNPIAIIIPCHRVIGADGKLTGYGGGLPTKQWLLEHERSRAQPYLIQRPSSRSEGRLP
jgi:methylated-DNA-[protein]-cysteine S-methyltransferase